MYRSVRENVAESLVLEAVGDPSTHTPGGTYVNATSVTSPIPYVLSSTVFEDYIGQNFHITLSGFAAHGLLYAVSYMKPPDVINGYGYEFSGLILPFLNENDCVRTFPFVARKGTGSHIHSVRFLPNNSSSHHGSWNNIVYFREFNSVDDAGHNLVFGFAIYNCNDTSDTFTIRGNFQVRANNKVMSVFDPTK